MPRKSGNSERLETPQDYDHKIADTLKSLHKKVLRSGERQRKLGKSLGKLEDEVDRGSKASTARLKAAYSAALRDSESEADQLKEALTLLQSARELGRDKRRLVRSEWKGKATPMRRGALMIALSQAAAHLPLWVGNLGDPVPALCGCQGEEAGHVLKTGSAVAGLVKGDEDEHNWILAEVRGPAADSATKWELEDVDEEQRERYCLPRKKILPLPTHRANPTTHPHSLFHTQATVLALYPQTTCFYKGVVEARPGSATEEYLVAFEDASYPTGFSPPLPVPQRYVIPYKDIPGAKVK